MDGFSMLDAEKKGWITAPELYETLIDLGYFAHRDLIYMLVRRFDRDCDGKLLYSDFADAFTPKSISHSMILCQRKAYYLHNNYDRRHFFTRETRELIIRCFKLYFQAEENAQLARKRLSKRPYFNVHEAFAALDSDQNGFITRDEFKQIL